MLRAEPLELRSYLEDFDLVRDLGSGDRNELQAARAPAWNTANRVEAERENLLESGSDKGCGMINLVRWAASRVLAHHCE